MFPTFLILGEFIGQFLVHIPKLWSWAEFCFRTMLIRWHVYLKLLKHRYNECFRLTFLMSQFSCMCGCNFKVSSSPHVAAVISRPCFWAIFGIKLGKRPFLAQKWALDRSNAIYLLYKRFAWKSRKRRGFFWERVFLGTQGNLLLRAFLETQGFWEALFVKDRQGWYVLRLRSRTLRHISWFSRWSSWSKLSVGTRGYLKKVSSQEAEIFRDSGDCRDSGEWLSLENKENHHALESLEIFNFR